ncbi:fungal-specific transcription factor domain-domain-containing protein [Lobosporangium transversale]|uniref:Fungal-specific transcription factor domain-domain-containing protein n=1 Tax=Lobosporangium transversale TaxID=64571 RepID=A0A1Y2GCQ7_9FUNG|nr:fungal-specific transcription factor domain-domain-containing protein [Lobosporangium transversale]ORZ05919.1 fungal-specific transcription factor domain-domain-containing protein [Lobosporangium transversale]|eukprot:XP_021877300.1 fungal-specific transcription factor domain-domain-containing protein [Lobosporangium transversale]
MAVPPQTSFHFQHIPHPGTSGSYQDPTMNVTSTASDPSVLNNNSGSKKQKTTPPCDRCRQRRIKCDRLEPTCSSCIKYKATCVRTAFPAGVPLSTVSVDAIGGPGLRGLASGKRDRHLTETEILDSCLRNVQSLQMNRLRRIEQFFDIAGIDETRLDEVRWLVEQIKVQQENSIGLTEVGYRPEEIAEKLGPRASVTWVRQLMPLLQATRQVRQIPTTAHAYPKTLTATATGANAALQATLSETGSFICPAPKATPFPTRVPLSVLNKTMFELSIYDCTEYLGPVAGTKATSWAEEMRFPIPWLIPEPQVPEALLTLPPTEQMLDLIEWMIQSPLYTYFPILTKATILNALASALPEAEDTHLAADSSQAYADLGGNDGSLPHRITGRVSAVFLLNAIMALGAAYRSNAIKENTPHRLLRDPKSGKLDFYNFQLFFDTCRALTTYVLDQPRVSTLQGLLLLMKCPAIPGIQNLYREQACAMALALGLHRDPEPWILCRSVIQLRRNIFWVCYVVDASYSLNSSSPERFPEDYITIGLPTLPSIESGDDVGEIDAENETQRIGFLIEQAKLWKIVKKIRRCGQASKNSSESYCEGSNLYRSSSANISPVTNIMSPHQGHSANGTFGQPPYSQIRASKAPGPSSSQPAWVWRADSARRILDVELAQWQMELPQHLRFDHALTRQDDPCPFKVRVNGLGAMLQIIFNEVLILLHHPFLVLADSQSQSKRDYAIQTSGKNIKVRSSTSSSRSPRSRSSSTPLRSSFSTNLSSVTPQADDGFNAATRSLPPFLNTCTKAAEAITFLIEHLLRTTPEWLVCHNEVESALHFAERVHTLNVTMAINSSRPSLIAHVSGQQAKAQLRKTRGFRKAVKELDQFTMSGGCRLDLLSKEQIASGLPRERLMRSIKQMMAHKRGSYYYRLPRSPPEADLVLSSGQQEAEGRAGSTTGQDHLEMRLAYHDQRIWIRYYNIRIKDGVESRNGTESWLEILNPFVPLPELDIDTGDDEDSIRNAGSDDMSMPIYENGNPQSNNTGKQTSQKRSNEEANWSSESYDESMDPPQISSTALMEIFSNPNPSGLANYSALLGESNQPSAHGSSSGDLGIELGTEFDMLIRHRGSYSQDTPLDNFDKVEPSLHLNSPVNGPSDLLQSGHSVHGFNTSPMSPTAHHQPQHHQPQHHQPQHHQHPNQRQFGFPPDNSFSQSPFQQQQQQPPLAHLHSLQQDQRSAYPGFNFHATSVATTRATPPTTEATLSIDLVPTSNPMRLQPVLALDGGNYLSILQQHFPHEQVPSQPHGSTSMQSFQQQQSLDPSLDVVHQGVRPFYGVPVGGFMAPSLDILPEINRTVPNDQRLSQPNPRADFPLSSPSSSSGQKSQQPSVSPVLWPLGAQAITRPAAAASYSTKPEPLSPPSISSSIPTSPLPQSPLKMVLSPTTDALSHRLNSWDGLGGSKTDTPLEYPSTSPSSSSFQQNTPASMNHYSGSWSSTSSTSDLITATPTNNDSLFSVTSGVMDGVETSSISLNRHPVSAVPKDLYYDITPVSQSEDRILLL